MGFRLLAFDLDGTVLHSDRTISARTERAIHKAAEAGLILVPATGRSLTSLPKELLGYPEIRYMILGNGSFVYDSVNKCKIYEDCLLKSAADTVFSEIEASSLWAVVYHRGCSYVDEDVILHPDHYFMAAKLIAFMKDFNIPIRNMIKTMRAVGEIEKIELPVTPPFLWRKLWNQFSRANAYKLTSSLPGNMEINSATTTKGNALAFLCRHLGISLNDTVSFGDGNNDMELIKNAGIGVAMKNAIRKLKSIADDITLSNNRDGVAVWIERHLLQ